MIDRSPFRPVGRSALAQLIASVPMALALFALLVGFAATPQISNAQTRSGIAFSVQASSLGPSAGLHFRATEALHLRLRGSYLPYTYNDEFEDNDVTAEANADLKLGGPEARIEWHPFKTAFHLSGGALLNITEADASVVPTEPYEYSDTKTFSPEKLGSLDATVSYPSIAPYAGIGFGNALNSRWSFLIELGAYYTGSPQVEMEGTGLIKPTEQNAVVLEKGFESFAVLPHFAFGLAYQF